MNVSACLVTRGNVDMQPVIGSLPADWEIIVWDNGRGRVEQRWSNPPGSFAVLAEVPDLGPYGRFAAIPFAKHPIVYVQDDDVIVSDPMEIAYQSDSGSAEYGRLVCNMPAEFRSHYPDSAITGFGAAFHRNLPEAAFRRFFAYYEGLSRDDPLFLRESCRVFTTLTPFTLVDVPRTDREFASDPDRLWRQPDHVEMRERMLALTREVRDASNGAEATHCG